MFSRHLSHNFRKAAIFNKVQRANGILKGLPNTIGCIAIGGRTGHLLAVDHKIRENENLVILMSAC